MRVMGSSLGGKAHVAPARDERCPRFCSLPSASSAARFRDSLDHASQLHVEAGGLMAFAVEFRVLYVRAPLFIDKILKREKPGDIPIEQPTRVSLWINMRTARTLGLTIPRALLLQAQRVIE